MGLNVLYGLPQIDLKAIILNILQYFLYRRDSSGNKINIIKYFCEYLQLELAKDFETVRRYRY
jgi:hypothetical protein